MTKVVLFCLVDNVHLFREMKADNQVIYVGVVHLSILDQSECLVH